MCLLGARVLVDFFFFICLSFWFHLCVIALLSLDKWESWLRKRSPYKQRVSFPSLIPPLLLLFFPPTYSVRWWRVCWTRRMSGFSHSPENTLGAYWEMVRGQLCPAWTVEQSWGERSFHLQAPGPGEADFSNACLSALSCCLFSTSVFKCTVLNDGSAARRALQQERQRLTHLLESTAVAESK